MNDLKKEKSLSLKFGHTLAELLTKFCIITNGKRTWLFLRNI